MENVAVKVDLKRMTRFELREWAKTELQLKGYRGDQIFEWLHKERVREFSEMTNLSKALRQELEARAMLGSLNLEEVLLAEDGTKKLLLKTSRGEMIESVLIPMDGRVTQCVSSQVGCKMACDFCFTARMPRRKNLMASEILDQVYWGKRVLEEEGQGRSLSNIVYMGMGEPMDNYDEVVHSLHILSDEKGMNMAPKRITVSSSGVAPKIAAFGKEVTVNLAISLNASSDEQRNVLIPINRKWNLGVLLGVLRDYPLLPRRVITMEYVMLKGVNDSAEDAYRVVELLRELRCKVNLIPFNPWPGTKYERPEAGAVDAFARILLEEGYTVTVRYSKGEDIGAACGQLDGNQVATA